MGNKSKQQSFEEGKFFELNKAIVNYANRNRLEYNPRNRNYLNFDVYNADGLHAIRSLLGDLKIDHRTTEDSCGLGYTLHLNFKDSQLKQNYEAKLHSFFL